MRKARVQTAETTLLLGAVSFSYAALRLAMNREFAGARWQDLLDLTAPRPFVGRLLVPRLLHVWQSWTGASLAPMFLTVETLAMLALLLGVVAVLRGFVGARAGVVAAMALAWGLAVPFLLQHVWPIYYPYDTPAMAFTVWGLWAALRGRTKTLAALTLFAALNRETALLLPLLALAVWWPADALVMALRRVAPSLLAYAAARGLVWAVTRDLPGPPASFLIDGRYRFVNNAAWLNTGVHAAQVVLFTLGLPLAYLVVRRHVPPALRLVRLPLVGLFLGLMIVGNLYEPRIFGEIIVALYVPVALGAVAWAQDREPTAAAGLDRVPWGICAVVAWWLAGTFYG